MSQSQTQRKDRDALLESAVTPISSANAALLRNNQQEDTCTSLALHIKRQHSISSNSSDDDDADAGSTSNKRRRSLFSGDSFEDDNDAKLPATQPFNHSQDDSVAEDTAPKQSILVQDAGKGKTILELFPDETATAGKDVDIYSIGRDPSSSLVCDNKSISRHHADLLHDRRAGCFRFKAHNDCWVLRKNGKWEHIFPESVVPLDVQWSFRLLPNSKHAPESGVEFCLGVFQKPAVTEPCGSASMDEQYLELLRMIKNKGVRQDNKKGPNRTLRDPSTLQINLANDDDNDLLPITTLRKIFPQAAILEAVWYLRGENHIYFLQKHNQKFWDKQARHDGWLGLNYGLLTKYPQDANTQQLSSINQLEERVLKPLCDGETSRNMLCTLSKPGEPTVQQACTSSVQFAVSGTNKDILDLTVTQRSSDVILGLPHDVIVWAIVLHLVRRDVRLRSERTLRAGQLNFIITGGGAHVYDINTANMEELLDRKPIPNVRPYLVVDESCAEQEMMELAKTYDDNKDVVKLRAACYTKDSCHPKMDIEQAV